MALYAKSPSEFMTTDTLMRLRASDWSNADTGLEISHEEGENLFFRRMEKLSDASLETWLTSKTPTKTAEIEPFLAETQQKGELKMSIKIRDAETDGPSLSFEKANEAIDKAALLRDFQQTIEVEASKVIEKTMGYADMLYKSMIDGARADISAAFKPKVMWVEIEGEKRQLKKRAAKCLDRLILNAKCGLNSLLVGPAGSGKTIAAEQLSEALALPFASVCFTAGASETWLFGRQTPNGFIEGPFSRLFRDGGVFLADEMDAADANLLLAINTALANGFLFNPISGQQFTSHKDFHFVAGANTVGMGADGRYTGRNRLDAATLTRFIKIEVDYDEEIEMEVCPDEDLRTQLQHARRVLREDQSEYLISTRCIDYSYRQKVAGLETSVILKSLTMGWPEEIVKKTGLHEPKVTKKKRKHMLPEPEAIQQPLTGDGIF